MYVSRPAKPQDDLEALWPETTAHALNLDQVLLITDEEGAILGGAVVFHAGHTCAYVGAVKIMAGEHPQWVAHALWRYIIAWCKERHVSVVAHGAGTPECCEAMTRFGGTPVREHVLYEVVV
jgi:hypothetical protein